MFEYSLASSSWGDEELQAIQRVIDKGMFTMGEYVSQFETEFAKYFGSKYAVMVNSGSSANLLMIAALFYRKEGVSLRKGDEVIVPAVSWSTTYYPLYQYGLKLKFVDIDGDTLNFNLEALEKAVTDKTKAILSVNLLGNPNDFGKIKDIIAGKDIILLEDNCESMGSRFDGKFTGTHGLMGSFSTFFSHHMSTMEGGMIITDDEELYHILLSIRAHGWTRNLPKKNKVTGEKSDNAFEESFKFVLPGYNMRPLEMSGSIGLEQLKKLPVFVEERQKNARVFCEEFSSSKVIRIQKQISESSWFGFSLVIEPDSGIKREDVIDVLEKAGVEVRPIVTGNFTNNEVMNWFDYEIQDTLTNAELIDKQGLFIGNHHYDVTDKIRKVKAVLQEHNMF